MPIYEFRCADCGHVFEELVLRKSDEAGLACPRCASHAVERELSACAIGGGGGSGGGSCAPRGGFS
ncbi:MAG TPA: zinc ribbon domain-containing protein [Polyangia bacterium]|jgi:putative FmdB family regulatory protein